MRFFLKLFLALVLAPVAWGYVVVTDDSGIYVQTWNPGTIAMELKMPNTQTLQDGTTFATSVQAAMQSWNSLLGAVQFTAQITNTPMNTAVYSTSSNDTHNEIVMDSQYDGLSFDSSTLAITVWWRNNANTLAQADIVFNTAWSWDSYRGNRQGAVDIRRVAIHELGHVLGLDHPDNPRQPPIPAPQKSSQSVVALMNSRISDLDTMQADDIAGARLLYGSAGFVPANNDFASAATISLSSGSMQFTGTNVGASRQSGEPNHAGATAIGHSVWWKWTAPGSGSTTITTLGSNFDTVLAVYTGTSITALTAVGSNDDAESPDPNILEALRKRTSIVTFSATGGSTYFIAVDGWGRLSDGDPFTYTGAVTLNLDYTGSLDGTAPSITTQPTSQTVTAGTAVTFTAAAAGNPAPTYQWQKNSVAIAGATNTSYTIASPTALDAASYTVVATNSAGSATSNAAVLTVLVGPSITTQPISQTVGVGTAVTFTAAASGNPTPTYQWRKNSVNIAGATNTSYTIASPTVSDAASYTVVATNSAGSATSNAAVLTVIVMPSSAVISITVE